MGQPLVNNYLILCIHNDQECQINIIQFNMIFYQYIVNIKCTDCMSDVNGNSVVFEEEQKTSDKNHLYCIYHNVIIYLK